MTNTHHIPSSQPFLDRQVQVRAENKGPNGTRHDFSHWLKQLPAVLLPIFVAHGGAGHQGPRGPERADHGTGKQQMAIGYLTQPPSLSAESRQIFLENDLCTPCFHIQRHGYCTLGEAFNRLDFSTAILDSRRFNYVVRVSLCRLPRLPSWIVFSGCLEVVPPHQPKKKTQTNNFLGPWGF